MALPPCSAPTGTSPSDTGPVCIRALKVSAIIKQMVNDAEGASARHQMNTVRKRFHLAPGGMLSEIFPSDTSMFKVKFLSKRPSLIAQCH